MTNSQNKPLSHASRLQRDDFIHQIANYVIEHNCSVDRAIADFAKASFMDQNFILWLSGSIYTGFAGNSQNFMMQKILKVNFGSNANMLIGNLVHLARDVSLKHKFANGVLPNIMLPIRAMKIELCKEYQFLSPDELSKTSKLSIFKTAIKLFRVYFEEVLVFDTSIESERDMKVDLPLEMFKNINNASKFKLSGIADSVYLKNKEIGIADLKTSKTKISGYVEMDKNLVKFHDERKLLYSSIEDIDKRLKKLTKASKNLEEAKTTLVDVEAKLEDAKSNGKKTLALEKRVVSWGDKLQIATDNFNLFEKLKKQRLSLYAEVSELNELIKPLKQIFDKEKREADLAACIKAHEPQLAHYALCYMIATGKPVKYLKVEVIVKNEQPIVQVFEWELTDRALEEAEERIQSIISLMELALDGVDPLILFRGNPNGYIGSETEAFKDEVKKIIKSVENQ